MDILELLQNAMHAESAYYAPQTMMSIEIMRLAKEEIERLRAALRHIANGTWNHDYDGIRTHREYARRTLDGVGGKVEEDKKGNEER